MIQVTRLVFHLGMPKTGTSVLQNSVLRVLDQPEAAHLLLPELGRGPRGSAHHGLAKRLAGLGEDGQTAPLVAELKREIGSRRETRAGPLIAFCTSEEFTNLCGINRARHLAGFLAGFGHDIEVQALLVIREFSDFLESMYLQSARAGHMRGSFEQYINSRIRWARDLFQGIAILQRTLGPTLRIEFQDGDFDILDYCDGLLDLPGGALRTASAGVPSTAKRKQKEQVALTFLDQVVGVVGFPIDRRKLARVFNRAPAFFDNDTRHYTLYRPEQRLETYQRFQQIMRDVPFPPYVEAFARYRTRDLPQYRLDFGLLGPGDLAILADWRNHIQPDQ